VRATAPSTPLYATGVRARRSGEQVLKEGAAGLRSCGGAVLEVLTAPPEQDERTRRWLPQGYEASLVQVAREDALVRRLGRLIVGDDLRGHLAVEGRPAVAREAVGLDATRPAVGLRRIGPPAVHVPREAQGRGRPVERGRRGNHHQAACERGVVHDRRRGRRGAR
jgi:hypothetical protein